MTSTFTGRGGIPATGVAAISVNITVVNPTVNGSLVAWPAGATRPSVSGVLFAAGQAYASGSSILRLNASGQASFFNASTGTVRILVDVAGYYTTDDATTGGSRYVPVKQTRILDTRNKIGVPTNTAVLGKGKIDFAVAGVGGLPAASAITSVAISLTALVPLPTSSSPGGPAGGMIVYPAGAATPGVAHGNWPVGRPKSSTVVTRVAANGQVTLMNTSNGAVHFLAEVTGYYTTATNNAASSSRISTLPLAARVLDTGGTTLIAAGFGHTFKVAGLGGLPATGLAAVSANLIVATKATSGDIVAYPGGETAPVATDTITLPTHYSFNQILVRPNAAGEITILNRSNVGARFYLDVSGYALKPKAPAAPTDVQATPADKSVKLSWTAPQDTGDQPLKSYEVTRTPGNVVTSVTGTSTTITGLINDTSYTFKVVAVNAAGRSPAALSTAVSPAAPAPPGQPFITAVTSRDSAAAVSWDAPAGLPEVITSYTVTAMPGGVTMTVPGTTRAALLKGLVNDTTYAITVKATNAYGSTTSDPRPAYPVLAKVPLAPPINAVTALNGRVDVQWVRPADGGAEIDNYEVTTDPVSVTQTIPADTTITALTGLTNGLKYTIKIRAHNKAGYGTAAITTSTPVAARPPGLPDDVKAAPSAGGVVQLSWTAPIDIGTSAVTGYRVTVTPGGQVLDVTTASAAVNGLDPATEYQFAVAAKNTAGTGAATTPTTGIKPVLTTKVAPIVLTPESRQQVSSLTPTAIVVATPTSQLSGLQVGQTVIADAGPTTPQGFLRKVTKVQTVGGLLVLNTEDAALSDVYADMALATQFKATDGDVAGFVPAGPGIRLAAPTAAGKTRQQGGFARSVNPDEGKLYIKDSKLVVEVEKELRLGQRITGSVTLDPKFGLKIGTGLVPTSKFRIAFDTDSSFRYDMTLGKSLEQRMPLGRLMLKCITVGIGGAPVVICPVGELELVLAADGRAGIAWEVKYQRRLGLELNVTGPMVTPTAVNEEITNDELEFNHGQLVGNVAASAGFAAKFIVAFYGQGGPEVELTPYFEWEADTAADPAQKLVFGVQIGGGLEFNFLQRKVVRWVKPDVLKFEVVLWDSGGPYTGVVIDPGSAEIGSGGTQQFTARLIGFPAEPVTWRVSKGPGSIDSTGLFRAASDGLIDIEVTVPRNPAHPELKNTASIKVSGFLPSEPRNVRATAGIRTADVAWDPQEFSGRVPVTHYMVSTSPSTGAVKVPVTAGNRVTLRNLTPNTDYTVTVTAVNADGIGLPGTSGKFTPRTSTLTDPGGSDVTAGVDGEEPGIDGVVFSDSGRYAFFGVKKPADRQFYLVRRDLADRSDEIVSVKADGTTPEPIASEFPRVSSATTAPNYALSGEGRYIAYRTAAGSVNTNDQIAVRDLETGEHWTTPVTPFKVSTFRLSADGAKVTYITGNGGDMNRRVWQATKGQADARWLDGCFDPKSCGSGSGRVLGVTPDGGTVMYNFETEDPASPYLTATNRVMVLNVGTGQKTMPYVNQGLNFGMEPVISSDASWIMGPANLGDDFNPQYVLAARKVGTGVMTVADVVIRGNLDAIDISNDGERIAWRDEAWRTYPDPARLHVFSRSTKSNWTAPGVPGLGYYEDELVDLAPSGSAVSWRPTGQSGRPFLSQPWGAAVG